jgi:hypothetical protein
MAPKKPKSLGKPCLGGGHLACRTEPPPRRSWTATTSPSWRPAADARLSNAELATRIGLSAAPTWRRVRWLEEQGYITGYRAEIDRRKIGLGVLAFVRVDAERNNAEATRRWKTPSARCPR